MNVRSSAVASRCGWKTFEQYKAPRNTPNSTMRTNVLFCASSLSLPLFAPASPLAPASLPTYLDVPNVFHRYVTPWSTKELEGVRTVYRLGESPTKHRTQPTDFSNVGGLYVLRVGVLFPVPIPPTCTQDDTKHRTSTRRPRLGNVGLARRGRHGISSLFGTFPTLS